MKNRSTPSTRTWPLFLLASLTLAAAAGAQSPTPSFSKSFAPGTIGPGSVSTLTFVISNNSAFPVRSLAFTDTLPAGVTIASPAAASTTCQGGTLSAPVGGGTVSYTDGGVGANRSCTVKVNVTSSTPGTHTNVSGDLTSDAGNSGTATADLVVATDRPGFSKSFSPSAVFFGDRSRLTFTIDNSANGTAAHTLTFTDTLPSGLVVASPANRAKTCAGGTFSAPAGSSVISYSGFAPVDGRVGAGTTCTLSVDVVANAIGSLGNVSGELTSTLPNDFNTRSSGKASATLTVTVEQIAVSKTFTDDPVAPGGTVTLSFTVRNLDRGFDATNIAFTDDLDATLSGLEAVGLPTDPCGAGSALSGTSVLSLTGGSLAPGATCTFSATLQVPSTAATGGYPNTTSAITADIDGSPVTGDPASDTLFVEPVPLLTKSFTDDPVGAGGTATLEFTITNTSTTSTATDIAFEDVFDIILQTASSVPADGFCGAGSTATFFAAVANNPARLEVSGAELAAGDSCTFSVVLDVLAGVGAGTYANTTGEITATIDGETFTGNPASDGLVVVPAPAIVKEFTDDPAAPGGTVTLEFTLTHDENATGDATEIAFTDDLAAALPGLSATGLPQNDVCGTGSTLSGTTTISLTDGTLAPGESCTFSVTLDVPASAAAGRVTNTTSNVTAKVAEIPVTGLAATDELRIAGLDFSKEFIDDPALPGDTVTLRFTIDNVSPTDTATAIGFSDDLDDTLSGLAATGLPQSDVCGTGSSVTGSAGNTLLTFQGGTLAAGETCTFDVTLQVPAAAEADVYANTTSAARGTFGGTEVFFEEARDELTIDDQFLAIAKEFVDDPVSPGDTVTLRFTLTNLESSKSVSSVEFTDDLDAALAGLVNASGTQNDVCGAGSQISGTDVLTFTGGSLTADASCSFDVTLSVPASASLGTTGTNTTSEVTGLLSGLFPVVGGPASDVLELDFLSFSKSFDGPATAGGTATLTFTIQNPSTTDTFFDVAFTDDLDNVLTGLTAVGLPANDVCGAGSVLDGASFVTLDGATVLPGGSCTFSVTVQVPAGATPGDYVNVTSELLQGGTRAAAPATATLTVLADVDEDDDGVDDAVDVCPGTAIPEGVPTQTLGVNRFALVDDDGIFDTKAPNGNGPGESFTIEDTAGCSCEQIIAAQGLGQGHVKFGCSLSAMRDWVDLVNP